VAITDESIGASEKIGAYITGLPLPKSTPMLSGSYNEHFIS